MQQLLYLELLLKLAFGLQLVLFPLSTSYVFGLPKPQRGLWHRLLGSVLIGMAGAIYIEGRLQGSSGLGLAGLVVINLSAVAVMFASLVLGTAATTGRGRAMVALAATGLLILSLIEIANVPPA